MLHDDDNCQFIHHRVDHRLTDRAAPKKVSGLGLGTNEGAVTPSTKGEGELSRNLACMTGDVLL